MLMNTIKPYYIVKTTLLNLYILYDNIAESYPPPKDFPLPIGHPTFLVGPGIHFYQNQLKFASFKFFHRLSISVVNNGLLIAVSSILISPMRNSAMPISSTCSEFLGMLKITIH